MSGEDNQAYSPTMSKRLLDGVEEDVEVVEEVAGEILMGWVLSVVEVGATKEELLEWVAELMANGVKIGAAGGTEEAGEGGELLGWIEAVVVEVEEELIGWATVVVVE